MIGISFNRHHYPPEIVQHADWLYTRFTLSFRDVEDLLAERGIDVSNETLKGAGMGEVIVVAPCFVRLAHELAVGAPSRRLRIPLGISLRTAFAVKRVDRNLVVADPTARTVRVGIGEHPGQRHLVRTEPCARHLVVGLERRLLDFPVVVGRIAIERELADLNQRVVLVGPDLGDVETD
jgi:hypothetical protein